MSVGDEGLEPIHEDEGEAEQATLAHQGSTDHAEDANDDDRAYGEEEFYEDDSPYAGMEGGGSPGADGDNVPSDLTHEPDGESSPAAGMTERERDVRELMDLQRKYRMMMGDRQSFQKH